MGTIVKNDVSKNETIVRKRTNPVPPAGISSDQCRRPSRSSRRRKRCKALTHSRPFRLKSSHSAYRADREEREEPLLVSVLDGRGMLVGHVPRSCGGSNVACPCFSVDQRLPLLRVLQWSAPPTLSDNCARVKSPNSSTKIHAASVNSPLRISARWRTGPRALSCSARYAVYRI